MPKRSNFLQRRAAAKMYRIPLAYLIDNKIYCTRCMILHDLNDLSRPILRGVAEKQECICEICKQNILNLKDFDMNKKMKRICVLKQPFTMIEIPEDADPIAAKADWLDKHKDVDKTLGKEQARREAMTIRAGKVEQRRRTK